MKFKKNYVLKVFNIEIKQCEVIRVAVAIRFLERLCGLIGRDPFKYQDYLFIPRCNAIHTFGMSVPISLVWLDANYKIIKVVPYLARQRIQTCKGAKHVIEGPSFARNCSHMRSYEQCSAICDDIMLLEDTEIHKLEKCMLDILNYIKQYAK